MAASTPATSSSVTSRLAAMMFLQFFIWGAWYVTVGNYLTEQKMPGAIPWAYSVGPIAAIVSPFFLGMVADRFFATERVLAGLHLLGGVFLLALPYVAEGGPGAQTLFIVVLLAYTLCYMPTLGLSNSLAFRNLVDRERHFPLIRVFGTIGWIVANVVVSKLLHADTGKEQFYVAGAASILLGLFCFVLPHTPPPAAGQRTTVSEIMGIFSLSLMRQQSFAIFMVSSFLICIPLAAYYSYAPVFARAAGFADPAFNMSFGQMSEIFFMLVMPLCFARLGVKWMLAVGMLAWVARYGLFWAAAPTGNLALVMGGILLHGICYDFFFVTGQIYVDKKAPPAIRAQAQGFLVLVTQGVGMLIGAQVVGAVVAANTTGTGDNAVVDWQAVWLPACIAAAVVLAAFLALFRDDGAREAAAEGVPAHQHA